MTRFTQLLLLSLVLAPSLAQAQESDTENPGSSRLFYLPTPESVGAFRATLSYEGSLLKEPGILSSAGVFAVGVGQLAQIEYRHNSAIGIGGQSAPLPSVGLQLRLPIPTLWIVRSIAIAYRLGVPHEEEDDGRRVVESVTDVFAVARLRLHTSLDLLVAARTSRSEISSDEGGAKKTQLLPAFGLRAQLSESSAAIFEFSYAPKFSANGTSVSISEGITARSGLRWRVVPWLSLDASAGILSSNKFNSRDLTSWDIRLGAEVFIPWGHLACSGLGAFC